MSVVNQKLTFKPGDKILKLNAVGEVYSVGGTTFEFCGGVLCGSNTFWEVTRLGGIPCGRYPI